MWNGRCFNLLNPPLLDSCRLVLSFCYEFSRKIDLKILSSSSYILLTREAISLDSCYTWTDFHDFYFQTRLLGVTEMELSNEKSPKMYQLNRFWKYLVYRVVHFFVCCLTYAHSQLYISFTSTAVLLRRRRRRVTFVTTCGVAYKFTLCQGRG